MYYTKDYDAIIDNYIENCTDEEWKELLDKYNIDNEENYMGELREKIEEAILQDYLQLSFKEQVEMLIFFEKYRNKDEKEKSL